MGKQRHGCDAGVSFTAAGVIVAFDPHAALALGAKSMSAPVELCAVTAFCAVISSVIVEERRIRPGDPDPVAAYSIES